MSLGQIRDEVLKNPQFGHRDRMTLYRQIVRDMGKIPGVRKTRAGEYELKG
jgi:hypothetical protein